MDGFAAMKPPALEVADVMRTFMARQYIGLYGNRMPAMHRKAMADMLACRTPSMGGTTFLPGSCHHYQYSYHSCGNRNCNKCGNERAQHWLEKTGKTPAASRALYGHLYPAGRASPDGTI
jgi:hypothetical protein